MNTKMIPSQEEISQILQSCLDQVQKEEETIPSVLARYPDLAEILRPPLEAALWLLDRAMLFSPRPGFVHSSRLKLIARFTRLSNHKRVQNIQVKNDPIRQEPAGVFNLLAPKSKKPALHKAFSIRIVLTLLLIVLGIVGSGIALASQTALPGETFYPVKTSLERAMLLVALRPESDARLHINFARRRLIEIHSLVLDGRYHNISGTVADFEAQINQTLDSLRTVADRDRSLAKELVTFLKITLSDQLTLMHFLSDVVPPQTRLEFEQVQKILDQGLQEAQWLLP